MDFINENGIIGFKRNLEYPTLREKSIIYIQIKSFKSLHAPRESFVFGFKFNGKKLRSRHILSVF